jgi:integrase
VAARKIDGKWYADFRLQHADGSVERVRKRSPVQSKAGADEFEHQLRTALLTPTHTTKEVPTFAAYADEFKKTYVLANNKPSERAMKASILKHHLLPVFGEMRLDAIKMHAIEILKAALLAKGLSRKRVNNILACLGKMLRYAHEIELIEVVPRVKLLKVPQQRFDFLTFEELSRLVEAMKDDSERLALVLLGAEAGLRQGETMALEWGDVISWLGC